MSTQIEKLRQSKIKKDLISQIVHQFIGKHIDNEEVDEVSISCCCDSRFLRKANANEAYLPFDA